jgi:GNAT superfamily N-acetyltransferase
MATRAIRHAASGRKPGSPDERHHLPGRWPHSAAPPAPAAASAPTAAPTPEGTGSGRPAFLSPGGLAAAWPPDTITVIATTGPIAWRRLAYELAQVARRAGRYDFASFPAPIGRGRPDPQHTRALLYCHGDVVAGYLVLVDASTAGRYHLTGRQHTDTGRGQLRPTVGLVFVAYHLRRGGIGRALLRAAAEHAAVAPTGLAWWTPFTDAGAALARSAAGPDGGVWIA